MKNTIVSVEDNSIHYQVIDDSYKHYDHDDHKEWSDDERAEFEKAYAPLVEYLHKKWSMHTWILVERDRVTIVTDEFSSPVQAPIS